MASIQTTPTKLQPNILEPKYGKLQPANEHNPDNWSTVSSNTTVIPDQPNENDEYTKAGNHASCSNSVDADTLSNPTTITNTVNHSTIPDSSDVHTTENPVLLSATRTHKQLNLSKRTWTSTTTTASTTKYTTTANSSKPRTIHQYGKP